MCEKVGIKESSAENPVFVQW